MNRKSYLDMAASGLRMPIGTHLVLHEQKSPEEIMMDGRRLGAIVEEAARQFRTPLAVPLMDLTLEKAALLKAQSVPDSQAEAYHFEPPPVEDRPVSLTPRMIA